MLFNSVLKALSSIQLQRFELLQHAYFLFCALKLLSVCMIQGYFLRATILQEAILLPHIAVPHTIKPGTVVSDYCTAHLLKDNVEALTEAIIFAVDNNCKHIVLLCRVRQ